MKTLRNLLLCVLLWQTPAIQNRLGQPTMAEAGLMPSGAIMFVDTGTCPSGYTEEGNAGNYVILTTNANGNVGTTGGSNSYTPAGTNGTVAFTPAGTLSWPGGVPIFTGSALGTHSHGAGTLADATSGSTVKLFTSSGSGVSAVTHSGSTAAVSAGTPAGTIAWPVGVPALAGTPGTVPAETFSGTPATLTPTFLRLIGCKKT